MSRKRWVKLFLLPTSAGPLPGGYWVLFAGKEVPTGHRAMGTGLPWAPEDGIHTSSTAGLVQKGMQPPLHNVLPNSSELKH